MSKGDPKIDEIFECNLAELSISVGLFKNQSKSKTLNNLDQKVLRRSLRDLRIIICKLKEIEANMAMYLDVRNEQGRGALSTKDKKSKSKKKPKNVQMKLAI